jgi:hypothetical protein
MSSPGYDPSDDGYEVTFQALEDLVREVRAYRAAGARANDSALMVAIARAEEVLGVD